MSKTECEQANKPEVNEKVDKELLQNAKVCFKKIIRKSCWFDPDR